MSVNINLIQDTLDKVGFIVIDLNIPVKTLEAAQVAYMEVYKKAKLREYKYIRVYDDYLGRMNISGIEMCFHPEIVDSPITDLLNYSNSAKIAMDILGEKVKMPLSRYHMTGKYSHVGNWLA
jgi:hypothetical protein